MKKLIKMILAGVAATLLICSLLVTASAACSHEWEYKSGTIDCTDHCISTITYECSLCHETKTEKGESSHKSNGTIRDDGVNQYTVCKECGDEFVICHHNWQYDSGRIDCTNHCISIITYRCNTCNATKTENGVNSHKSNGVFYYEGDRMMTYCKECGDAYSIDPVSREPVETPPETVKTVGTASEKPSSENPSVKGNDLTGTADGKKEKVNVISVFVGLAMICALAYVVCRFADDKKRY